MQENAVLVHKGKGADKWGLFSHKIKYIDHGTENEVYTSDVSWYEAFAQMHEEFQLIEVEEITYTEDQVSRFKEIEDLALPDSVANNYVVQGVPGEGLETLVLKKENEELRQLLADLAEVVLLGGVLVDDGSKEKTL